MTFDFTKGFLKRLKKLPGHVQSRTLKALDLLAQDERYPSLHFKEVSAQEGAWSVRVSQDDRMVGYCMDEHVTWFWIGKHDDYDTLLSRLVGCAVPHETTPYEHDSPCFTERHRADRASACSQTPPAIRPSLRSAGARAGEVGLAPDSGF